jgi:hypothetical protein
LRAPAIALSFIVIIGRAGVFQAVPRTIVDIPDELLREVGRLCRALRISRAEAVRQGVAAFLKDNEAVHEDGFGLWRDAAGDSRSLMDRMRSRW